MAVGAGICVLRVTGRRTISDRRGADAVGVGAAAVIGGPASEDTAPSIVHSSSFPLSTHL